MWPEKGPCPQSQAVSAGLLTAVTSRYLPQPSSATPQHSHLPKARCRPDQQQVRRARSPSTGSWRCLHGVWASSDHLAALKGRLWEEAQAGRGWITRVAGKVFCRTEPNRQGGAELGLSSQSNAPVQPAATLSANSNPLAHMTSFSIGSLPGSGQWAPRTFEPALILPFFCWSFPPHWGLTMNTARKVSGPPSTWIYSVRTIMTRGQRWERESISIWTEGSIPASQRQDMLQL